MDTRGIEDKLRTQASSSSSILVVLGMDKSGVQVELNDMLVKNPHSTVFLGKRNKEVVVVKKIIPKSKSTRSVQSEIEVMQKLTAAKAPNVVKYVSDLESNNCYFIVMEYMNRGSLTDFIKINPLTSLDIKMKIIVDVATGITGMHRLGFLHRDIKGPNVLISSSNDEVLIAKLGDFGSALATDNVKGFSGTKPWMAPEVLAGKHCEEKRKSDKQPLEKALKIRAHNSKASDVYSFGVVMYEVMAWGKEPYSEEKITNIESLVDLVVCKEKTLTVSEEWPTKNIMKRCLLFKPSERIKTAEILPELEKIKTPKLFPELEQIFNPSSCTIS